MYRYPELTRFRALPGTADALNSPAESEGKRLPDIVRELVAERLRKNSAPAATNERAA